MGESEVGWLRTALQLSQPRPSTLRFLVANHFFQQRVLDS